MHICFYSSDHGFGHAMRCLPIIEELLLRGEKLTVVCGERQIAAMQDYLNGYSNISYRAEPMDIGLILKPGTLDPDVAALTKATTEYLVTRKQRAEKEALWLRENAVDIAVCDMPIWSIEACELAGIPLLYVGNFTWTELYREHLPETIWKAYGHEYNRIKYALLYSPHNSEMLGFLPKAEIKETSLVARRFDRVQAEHIRAKHHRPLVFVALGMSAEFTETIDVSELPYDFIVNQGVPLTGRNVVRLETTSPDTHNIILASDYVIAKAGWGTVAECLLAKKKVAFFERDSVLEDRTTIRILESQKLAVKVQPADLQDIRNIIKRMDTELSDENFELYYDAAEEIADHILKLVRRNNL